jgi:hypothetical protein
MRCARKQRTATRSATAVGFKNGNNFGALLSGGDAAIGLHFVTAYHLVGISDEAIKRRFIPCQTGVLHGTRIVIVWNRSRLPTDYVVQVWPKAIVAFLQRMAGAADIVEHELIVRTGAFSGRILPERISADRHECSERQREWTNDDAAQ